MDWSILEPNSRIAGDEESLSMLHMCWLSPGTHCEVSSLYSKECPYILVIEIISVLPPGSSLELQTTSTMTISKSCDVIM
jgi:hypothetical protein